MSEQQSIIVKYGGFFEPDKQDNYLIVFRDEYSESQRSSRTHGPRPFAEVTNDLIHDITKGYNGRRIYT